jgi:CDP-paratose 2-epimerase
LSRVLITGGAGFIGANLADRLAADGCEVVVLDALARPGVERNLAWLKERHDGRLTHLQADVRDDDAMAEAVLGADAVFHLAAQVAVTTSLADPVDDFTVNLRGTLGVLEAVRRQGTEIPVIFASTNKVYGDLADLPMTLQGEAWQPSEAQVRSSGVSEDRPLDFHTPYGVSKGGADQYVLDYSRSYGVPTCVLRMSCIYGPRQMGTEDQGWVAHFAISALEGRPVTLYGDGRQVRDILDVADCVEAYVQAWRRIDSVRGQAFNLGGGPANAVSLRQLIHHIEAETGRRVEVELSDWRAGDQKWFVADARRAQRALGLAKPRMWREGVAGLIAWLRQERGLEAPRPALAAAS